MKCQIENDFDLECEAKAKLPAIDKFIKDAIDPMHQVYTRKKMPVRTEFLRDSLASITIYDSMIVLRKEKTAPTHRVSF